MSGPELLFGVAGGVLFVAREIPQPAKVWRTGDASGVSRLGVVNTVIDSSGWLLYGLLAGLPLMWISAAAALPFEIGLALLVGGRLRRRERLLASSWLALVVASAILFGATGVAVVLGIGVVAGKAPHALGALWSPRLTGIEPRTWHLALLDGGLWGGYGVMVRDPLLIWYGVVLCVTAVIVLARVHGTSRMAAPALVVATALVALGCAPDDSRPPVEQLNELIGEVALEVSRPDSPVVAVDMFTGFDLREYSKDGIHPNQEGEELLAQRWVAAVEEFFPTTRPGPPLRIMPLGDSITDDYTRYPLWRDLVTAGYRFDLVGSRHTLPGGARAQFPPVRDLPFDEDHDGHSGWTSEQLLLGHEIQPDAGRLDDWITAHSADVVLLHIGTNDLARVGTDPDDIIKRIGLIIAVLRHANPEITVFVAQIIPYAIAVAPRQSS